MILRLIHTKLRSLFKTQVEIFNDLKSTLNKVKRTLINYWFHWCAAYHLYYILNTDWKNKQLQKPLLLNLMIKNKDYMYIEGLFYKVWIIFNKEIPKFFMFYYFLSKNLKIIAISVFSILILKPFVKLIDSWLEFKLLCFEIH